MTEQQKKDALKYIEAQLEGGYLDLGLYDKDELLIIEEAIKMWKAIDEFNNVGCTSFMLTSSQIKEIMEHRPYDPIWDMYFDEFEDEETE